MSTRRDELLILAGPTASGKTAVAIELCEMLNGEIVSCDSMQIYRGMDIGTAKPSPEEQGRARHHLIDIVNPDEEYSAARWAADARAAVDEIRARGKTPILCGGTGFYLSALLFPQRLAKTPPDQKLRAQLEEIAAREGREVLHARLQSLDESAARRLHANDVYRVMRAIEVALSPASPATSDSAREKNHSAYSFQVFGLEWPRETIYARINARIDAMLDAGFLRELSTLLCAGYGDCAALQSLGYKQMRAALDAPQTRDECAQLWKQQTRRYAKRQLTWFRHQFPTCWIAMEKFSARSAADFIARQ